MAKEITTVFDYLDWRGDISFSQMPLCEVDSLIFSLLSYIDFDGIVPSPKEIKRINLLAAAKKFIKKYKDEGKPDIGFIIPKDVVVLLAKAAKTKRFGEVWLSSYENKICDGEEKQFSALTFIFKNTEGAEALFVAFRGTDDTIVGWKENFNMSFMQPVPSQLEAVEYLSAVAANAFGEITLGGHSKGGNLSVYAAVSAPERVKERINEVYNLDGPGFNIDFLASEEYRGMRDRIRTIVPHSSIVGMLLEHEESYEVISSSQTGLLQHNGFFQDLRIRPAGKQPLSALYSAFTEPAETSEKDLLRNEAYGCQYAGHAEASARRIPDRIRTELSSASGENPFKKYDSGF